MLKVVFFATPDIAVNSIMKLLNFADIHIIAVVTQPDRPSGRGKKILEPPIKTCAKMHSIPVFQTSSIKNDGELISKLKELSPDFFVTFAFGQILSQEVLDIPKFATINLHASLLPVYRGANPIQRAIFNGDKVTGITTMITALELDAGDICLQEKIQITDSMTSKELSDIISEKAPFLLYRTLKGLASGALTTQKQDDSKATFANKFSKSDTLIHWADKTLNIHNKIRAFFDYPCAYTEFNAKNLKVVESFLPQEQDKYMNYSPGQIVLISKDGVYVKTGDSYLLITKVKPENKQIISGYDWANGARIKVGDAFSVEVCK